MSELQEYVESVAQSIKNAADLMEYIENALDVEYIVGADRKYRGVRILITCGGPNVWIDTTRRAIEGYTMSEHASTGLPRCDEIDEILEETFNC
jgi:hypothetical protein